MESAATTGRRDRRQPTLFILHDQKAELLTEGLGTFCLHGRRPGALSAPPHEHDKEPHFQERDCAVRHAIGGVILSRRGFWVTAISRDLGQPLPPADGGAWKMRTLIDPRQTNRVPVAMVNRRHARARRQVLRERPLGREA